MRILFVTPQLPHPTQGGAAIRNWHLIRAARDAGHDACVVTFGASNERPCLENTTIVAAPQPRRVPHRVRDMIFRREPDLALRLGADALAERAIALHQTEPFDLIQVEGLEMWRSVSAINVPTMYDAHNAETTLQQQMAAVAWHERDVPRGLYSALQSRKLRRYEASVMRHSAITIAVSETDAAALHALAPEAEIAVVPIGVDTHYYAPNVIAKQPTERSDVVFTGTLDYRANRDAASWFCTRIWPIVRARKPNARLAIVGRNPPEELLTLNGNDGIIVTGAVPDDRPSMAGAGVYVLPIRFGAGVRVKLLNAMSMGCAIVATPAACEGIAIEDGTHLSIAAAEPEPFAASVIALLDDAERGLRYGAAARSLMQTTYDWSVVTPKLLAVYAGLEQRRVKPSGR